MTISKPRRGWISRFLPFALVLVTTLVAAHSVLAQTFTVLYSFKGPPDGKAPNGVPLWRRKQSAIAGQ